MADEAIAYTVCATFTDVKVANEWLAWLRGGHLQEVVDGGATDWEIVRMDTDGSEKKYEIRYRFPSRQYFQDYEANHAPRLRAEGLAKFPTSRGITYHRTVGAIIS